MLNFLFWVAFIIGFAMIFYYIEMQTFSVSKYVFEDDRILKDLKIVHLSDFHSVRFGENNETLIEKVKNLNPDIIIVTGDIVMYKHDPENAYLLMKQLCKIARVYFIRGNHDLKESNSYDLLKRIEQFGVVVCESKSINIPKHNVMIHGLMDFIDEEFENKEYLNGEKIKNLNRLSPDDSKYNILMTHRPYDFPMYSKDYNFDLVLCGHTHGGQWIFPFLGGFISPDKKIFFPEYDYGLKEIGNKKMIINRGLGGVKWAIRIFNRPEIGVIEINKKRI